MRAIALLGLMTAVVLSWCAPALADDASLFAAYDGRQGELKDAGQVYVHWTRRWNRSHGSRSSGRHLIRADRAIDAVLARIATDMKAQEPSSANGEKAKRYALAEIAGWLRADGYEIRGIRSWLAHHPAKSDAWFRRGNRTWKRHVVPNGRRAVRAFAAAGLQSPNRALSQNP